MNNSKIIIWFKQIRGPFLILSVALVLIGVGFAYREGYSNILHTIFLLTGVISAHISVNLFNEYSDFKTGIDSHTVQTPFSGGSGVMPALKTTPSQVKIAAYTTLFLSGLIGVYFFMISGWLILLFMISGAVAIRFYTSHLSRYLLGEFVAGLTLGTFVVLGSFYALCGHITASVIWISFPPGILTFLLLLLNEFPDQEADRKGGRHHLVIHFGKKKSAAIYLTGIIITFLMIFLTPLLFDLSSIFFLPLLTFPLGIKAAVTTIKFYNNMERLLPALGMNVVLVIVTDFLIAISGYLS